MNRQIFDADFDVFCTGKDLDTNGRISFKHFCIGNSEILDVMTDDECWETLIMLYEMYVDQVKQLARELLLNALNNRGSTLNDFLKDEIAQFGEEVHGLIAGFFRDIGLDPDLVGDMPISDVIASDDILKKVLG